jgi:hypothetical protein
MTCQEDMRCQLKETSKSFVAYSIATDKSTDINDNIRFAGFIRGANEDFHLMDELLELVPMIQKEVPVKFFLKR